jgi:hypothetical protein
VKNNVFAFVEKQRRIYYQTIVYEPYMSENAVHYCDEERFGTIGEMIAEIKNLRSLLELHKRYHSKVGCPGHPDCYVCEAEAREKYERQQTIRASKTLWKDKPVENVIEPPNQPEDSESKTVIFRATIAEIRAAGRAISNLIISCEAEAKEHPDSPYAIDRAKFLRRLSDGMVDALCGKVMTPDELESARETMTVSPL